eukprot:TRINITY_DN9642_c0_g1_i6.p1 TRINITY_DN9642_c0_g1~~TRINITY_DN9642_c0_g1_i6.p1  ORF type:complete len:240 (-),score=44.74 TRINITY_DN9642_c0_g1_i6:774-1493(-)
MREKKAQIAGSHEQNVSIPNQDSSEKRKVRTPGEKGEELGRRVERCDSFLELYIQRVVISKKVAKREKLPIVIQSGRERNSLRRKITEESSKREFELNASLDSKEKARVLYNKNAKGKMINETEIVGRPLWNQRIEKQRFRYDKSGTQPSDRKSLLIADKIKTKNLLQYPAPVQTKDQLLPGIVPVAKRKPRRRTTQSKQLRASEPPVVFHPKPRPAVAPPEFYYVWLVRSVVHDFAWE